MHTLKPGRDLGFSASAASSSTIPKEVKFENEWFNGTFVFCWSVPHLEAYHAMLIISVLITTTFGKCIPMTSLYVHCFIFFRSRE